MAYGVCPALPDIAQEYGCTPYSFEIYWPRCASGRFHAGIDLWDASDPNAQGQPVYAPRDGVVVGLGVDSSLANHDFGPDAVCLQCDDGIYLWFAHLASALVSRGQRVTAGQVIGGIGSQGVSTGPHLHLEARTDPFPQTSDDVVLNSIDPTPYLSLSPPQPPTPQEVVMPAEVPGPHFPKVAPGDCPIDLFNGVNTGVDRVWVRVRAHGSPVTATLVLVRDQGDPVDSQVITDPATQAGEWAIPAGELGNLVLQSATGECSVSVKFGQR